MAEGENHRENERCRGVSEDINVNLRVDLLLLLREVPSTTPP